MNILKEKIKLAVSYPTWYKEIRKIEKSREKKIFLFGKKYFYLGLLYMEIWEIMQLHFKKNIFFKIFFPIMNTLKF